MQMLSPRIMHENRRFFDNIVVRRAFLNNTKQNPQKERLTNSTLRVLKIYA